MKRAIRSPRWYWIGAICLVLVPAIAWAAQTLSPPVTASSALTGPIIRITNSGTGAAVDARSKFTGVTAKSDRGFGIIGTTLFVPTSASGKAGVLGVDNSTVDRVANSGVSGKSNFSIGVSAQGVVGVNAIGDVAVFGTADCFGSLADCQNATAVAAIDNSAPQFMSWALYATSKMGTALYGETDATPAPQFAPPPTLQLVTHGGLPMLVSSMTGNILSLDTLGNMIIAGTLTQNGTPRSARRTAAGSRVDTYSAQQTSATVEDLGSAHLVSGRAFVALDEGYRSTIDSHAGYFVFLTAEADSNGLFVANKTVAGFEVQENKGGRSSLTFQYRIVAKPFGGDAARLPVDPGAIQYRAPRGHPPRVAPPR